MKYLLNYFILPLILLITCSASVDEKTEANPPGNDFNDYWYQGKAEVSSYKLEQARYGEMREGHVVLIFVTEDYSLSKHLKINRPDKAGSDLVKILKMNSDKKFDTGIYPYSIAQSVFTPVDLNKYPHTLRVTTSSQEWCGNTFSMIDLKKNNYEVNLHSYFEDEGDTKTEFKKTFLEDEIWTRIRIDHNSLPQGEIDIVPGSIHARFSHQSQKVEKAEGTLIEDGKEYTYTVSYTSINRKLSIKFEKEFPYKILSWEETYVSGFGANAKEMTTKATLNKSLFIDYWSKNHNSDSYLRKELGLEE